LLGLKYPGGPEIERFAAEGNVQYFKFPQAFSRADEMVFSFSGLKTSLRYLLEKLSADELREHFSDICASYQFAVVDILVKKMQQALDRGNFRSIGLSGGVANNRLLRERVGNLGKGKKIMCHLSAPQYTGDNASMIAFAAAVDGPHTTKIIDFQPNWPL
jgi:N6-L-threonylcarbamoyladenine synthase